MTVRVLSDPAELDDLHARLLAPNFRPSELLPAERLRAAVAAGTSEVLVLVEDGEPLATAIGEFGDGVVLLAYLAVASASRSRGAGGEMLEAAVGRWRARTGVRLVLAEVDRPDVHPSDPLQGDPDRRLAFYSRRGALAFDLPYFQPALGEGQSREHGMLLLTLGVDPALLSPDGKLLADVGPLRRFLQDYLGPIADGDTAGRRLLAAVEAPAGVRLLPVGEYRDIEPSLP